MANETGENGLEKKVSDLTGVAFCAILLFKVKSIQIIKDKGVMTSQPLNESGSPEPEGLGGRNLDMYCTICRRWLLAGQIWGWTHRGPSGP